MDNIIWQSTITKDMIHEEFWTEEDFINVKKELDEAVQHICENWDIS